MRALFDNPFLLMVLGLQLIVGVLLILALYWVVRLAVRHGVVDAHRRLASPTAENTSRESR